MRISSIVSGSVCICLCPNTTINAEYIHSSRYYCEINTAIIAEISLFVAIITYKCSHSAAIIAGKRLNFITNGNGWDPFPRLKLKIIRSR